MTFSYDPAKKSRNVAKHGVSLLAAQHLDWQSALIVEDLRKVYAERRFQALGLIYGRLHMLVFTPRSGHLHLISLRKANPREIARYDAAQARPQDDSPCG